MGRKEAGPGPSGPRRRDRLRGTIGIGLVLVALGGLGVKAVHGGQTVQALRGPGPVGRAELDVAYYDCLTIQAHSLVSGGRPVVIVGPTLSDFVQLMKAVGSWASLAGPGSPSTLSLSLESRPGPGSCRGNVVVARERETDGGRRTLVGTGASTPGSGLPPAPPL